MVDPATLGYDAAAATAFQRDADHELGQPVSPLTAVEVFYLDDGASLWVGVVNGAVVSEPGSDATSTLAIHDVGDQVRIVEAGVEPGTQAKTRTSSDPQTIALEPFTLVIGPQSGGTRVVVHDPNAPARVGFEARPWFPVDTGLIVGATITRDRTGAVVELPTTRGLVKGLPRAGELRFSIGGTAVSLTAFESAPGRLMVPFTDPTNGQDSYPVGRYVTVDDPGTSDDVVVDFNRATNPWCAYSDVYNCPIPPRGNAVATAVRAGERLDAAH